MINQLKMWKIVCSICIILFAANYIQQALVWITIVFILCLYKRKWKIEINKGYIILVIASIAYIFMYSIYYDTSIYTFCIIVFPPIFSYYIGKVFVNGVEENTILLIMLLSIGNLAHGILNLYTSQSVNLMTRQVIDFWSGNLLSVTLQGTFFSIAIGMVFFAILHSNICVKLLGVLVGIGCVWQSFSTASRTTVLLLIITIIFCNIYYSYLLVNRQILYTMGRALFIIIVAVVGIVFLFSFNIFHIKDLYINSPLFLRLQTMSTLMEDSRVQLLVTVLERIFEHPFGNVDQYYSTFHYAHNFWVDIGRQVGILPMALYIIYSIIVFKDIYKIHRAPDIKINTKILIVGVYFSCISIFMLEPILEGNPWLFYSLCIVDGGIHTLIEQRNKPIIGGIM